MLPTYRPRHGSGSGTPTRQPGCRVEAEPATHIRPRSPSGGRGRSPSNILAAKPPRGFGAEPQPPWAPRPPPGYGIDGMIFSDDYCLYAVVNAVFDNYSTFPFAFATSMWAILFLELWKRYQARLSCKWDTVDVQLEYEPPRPEYQASAKEHRRHPVTREWEPYISGLYFSK